MIRLPPLETKPVKNQFRDRIGKEIQPYKKNKDISLLEYNDRIFQLNRKYYKPPPPKPLSLNDIAIKILNDEQLLEFKSKYPKLSELEKK
jgi:hypothetical protein